MCLIINANQAPTVLTEDLVVYKILEKRATAKTPEGYLWISPFRYHRYELNTQVDSPLDAPLPGLSDFPFNLHRGLHSYPTLEAAQNSSLAHIYKTGDCWGEGGIFKARIPAGSKVFFGKHDSENGDDSVASNALIVDELVEVLDYIATKEEVIEADH